MKSKFKIKNHSGNSYSVFDGNTLLCSFQGPMSVSAAITFIKAIEKGKHLSPNKAIPYMENKEN